MSRYFWYTAAATAVGVFLAGRYLEPMGLVIVLWGACLGLGIVGTIDILREKR